MNALRTVCLTGCAAVSAALAQSTGAPAALQGLVRDTQGKPIAAAQVRYQRVVPYVHIGARTVPAPGEPFANGTAAADTGGAFGATGLPAGSYTLCASVPSAPYVDPCVWRQPILATLAAGTTSTPTLVLEKGVFLNLRINDPMHLLQQVVDGPWTPRKLLVGVTYGNGAYQGAQNTGVDAAGRDYQLIIPAGMPFKVRLFSRDVALTDVTGIALAASGTAAQFQAPAGQDQSFTFTVTGPAVKGR